MYLVASWVVRMLRVRLVGAMIKKEEEMSIIGEG